MADVVSHRFDGRLLRGSMAVTTLLISMIYMMIQFVGAGVLAELLLGVPFSVAVVVLAVLMTATCSSAGWSRQPTSKHSRAYC